MASKKVLQVRTSSLSVEVVSNGYKVKSKSKEGVGYISISSGGILTTEGSAQLAGEFVFQDFAGLVSFLRKRLSVPGA